jgi:predicted transcriptional regulator
MTHNLPAFIAKAPPLFEMPSNHALLISIRPRFVKLIFEGTKTVELRRVKPRLQAGDLVVVYASGSTMAIVGAFVVTGVTEATPKQIWRQHNGEGGLEKDEFDRYFEGKTTGYAIQIGKRWELPCPISLQTLRQLHGGFRPPQSYHYWKLDELLSLGRRALSTQITHIPR